MFLRPFQIGRRDGNLADEAGVEADVFQFGGLGGIGVEASGDPLSLRLALRRVGQIVGPDGLRSRSTRASR